MAHRISAHQSAVRLVSAAAAAPHLLHLLSLFPRNFSHRNGQESTEPEAAQDDASRDPQDHLVDVELDGGDEEEAEEEAAACHLQQRGACLLRRSHEEARLLLVHDFDDDIKMP